MFEAAGPGELSVSIEDVRAAERRLAGIALRSPLVRLPLDDAPAEIWLKLENLQPIGAFKLRGAANAMLSANPSDLAQGVWTVSAGNMAQGVAWSARHLGVPCRVVVPDHAPEAKLAAIRRLGGEIVKVPFATWWQIMVTSEFDGMAGVLVHPFAHPAVMAGNGTIGLEILADLPDVDTVIVPFGGGGLACGIATAVRALKPATRVFACEPATAAPVAASLAAGEPREIDYTASFADGFGGKSVLPVMWPLVRRLLAGSLVVAIEQIAAAIRLLAERNHVVAEGAGAAPVAAALSGQAGPGKIVCIISGGNIDLAKLSLILDGKVP